MSDKILEKGLGLSKYATRTDLDESRVMVPESIASRQRLTVNIVGVRCLFWDLPGLGLLQHAESELCLSGFARDLKSIVAQSGDQRPVLVGDSVGGIIIQTLARDDPAWFRQKAAGAALFNTTYTNPLETMILSRLLKALRKPLIVPMLTLKLALATAPAGALPDD